MLKALLRQSFPSTFPMIMTVFAALSTVVGGFAAAGLGWASEPGVRLEQGLAGMGLFVMPVISLMLLLGAVFEGKALAKGLLLGFSAAALGTGGVLMVAGVSPDIGLGAGVLGGSVCGLGPAALLGAVSLVYVVKGVKQTRVATRAAGLERMLDMLNSRGVLQLAEVAQETGLSLDAVDKLVEARIRDGRLNAELDLHDQTLSDKAWLAQQQARLPALVTTRGQVELQALSEELRVSRARLEAWIDDAVQRDALHGYVNWKTGVLFSRDAQAIKQGAGCPSCGGPLSLAGRGVVTCPACDAQIFL